MDAKQLKRYMHESGRTFIVFRAEHLVDALAWPDQVEQFQNIVSAYAEHRSNLETGETDVVGAVLGDGTSAAIRFPEYHTDELSLVEIDQAIGALETLRAKEVKRRQLRQEANAKTRAECSEEFSFEQYEERQRKARR